MSAGIGATDVLLNAIMQSDGDARGFKWKNLDTSEFAFGQFGPQLANRVYAGPASGSAAIPSFRILTAPEVGAQPHSDNLDLLAAVTPSEPGLKFLTLSIPVTSGYTKVQKVGVGTIVSVLTQAQLRTDIEAQPLSDGLTLLSPLTPTNTGMAMLVVPNPGFAGYPKHSGLAELQPWTFLTPAQLLADIGAGTGNAGGSGRGDDLAYSAAAEVTLEPGEPYIQWQQRITLDAGASDNYQVAITLSPNDAAKGAVFRVRIKFLTGCIATAKIYNSTDGPVFTPLLTISGDAELGATEFEFSAVFNGTSWGDPAGYYVNL